MDVSQSKFIVKYSYGDNAFRTHRIRILDHDSLNANFSRNDFSNQLFSSPKTFTNIAKTFQLSEDEITFKVSDKQVIINNYEAALSSNKRIMKSQMTMCLTEFNRSNITDPTSITFCFREFRAFLVIASYLRLNITMNFYTCGRPVSFMVKKFELFEVGLIMSTVSEDETVRIPEKSTRTKSKHNATKFNSTIKRKKQTRNENSKWKKQKKNVETDKSLLDDGNDDVFSQIPMFVPWKKVQNSSVNDDTQMSNLNMSSSSTEVPITRPKSTSRVGRILDDSPNISNYSSAASQEQERVPIIISEESVDLARIILQEHSDERSNVLNAPPQKSNQNEIKLSQELILNKAATSELQTINTDSDDIHIDFESDSEKLNNLASHKTKENHTPMMDIVPNSPERPSTYIRRTRRVFQRCFEPTFNPENFPGASQLLAENSDGE